jgi:tetratricopeptide (TPR) repeat protein
MGRLPDAASSLVQLLGFSPTDAEAWSELADLYLAQGMYQQAIYAMEEVLVLAPNAWNASSLHRSNDGCGNVLTQLSQIHARLGEMQYMAATAPGAGGGASLKYMAEAIKRFSRSIELCDDYLRGYYGLKLVRQLHDLCRAGSLTLFSDHEKAPQGCEKDSEGTGGRRVLPA